MPKNAKDVSPYDDLENHDWSKINRENDLYYVKHIAPQLYQFKHLSSDQLIQKLPQLQFDQLYQNLVILNEFIQKIKKIFQDATNDEAMSWANKSTQNKTYQPRIFLAKLYQAINQFQNQIPKRILNGIDYRQKLYQIGRYLPKEIIEKNTIETTPEYKIPLQNLELALNVHNSLGYDVLDEGPHYYQSFNKYFCQIIKNYGDLETKKLMAFFHGIIRELVNIRIRIVKDYVEHQIQPMTSELACYLHYGDYISHNEANWMCAETDNIFIKFNHDHHI